MPILGESMKIQLGCLKEMKIGIAYDGVLWKRKQRRQKMAYTE